LTPLRAFGPAEQGTVAVLFALAIVPLMGLVGAFIDYGRALEVRTQVATTLDAAVLAATQAKALDDDADVDKIVADFFDQNYTKPQAHGIPASVSLSKATISADGELTVTVDVNVGTTLMGIVGVSNMPFSLSSSARVGGQSLELALVLDNTGSMKGAKIAALKKAATDLVTSVMPDAASDKVKVALVPFAETVNIGVENRYEPGLDIPEDYTVTVGKKTSNYRFHGCMGSRQHDLNVRDDGYETAGEPGLMATSNNCGINQAIRLTNDKSTVLAGVDTMKATGMTYIPGGLVWGWRVLSPEAPFTEGVSYDDDKTQKTIVLMTDGDNTLLRQKVTDASTSHHAGEVWEHKIYTGPSGGAVETDGFTAELCENIKAQKIRVYTIAFEVESGSPVHTLLRNCAGNGGQYFDAADSGKLADAFNKITLALLNLRLSK
jgi:Flp pilus assembly protein TadG